MHELDGVRLASFKRRAVAFVIDGVAVLLLFLAVVIGIFLAMRLITGAPIGLGHINFTVSSDEAEGTLFELVEKVLFFMLYWGLLTFATNGKTFGKWVTGVRVVSLKHQRIGFWQSVERSLGYSVSFLEFGFGFLQYFLNRNRRTVHDRIAETIVIQDRIRDRLPKSERLGLEVLD